MKNKQLIFLILIIPVFVFALSGCKGGSSQPPASTSAPSAASTAVAKAPSSSSLSAGLWKMTFRSTTQMPSIAGRPAMNHTYSNSITTCVKPGSKQAKSYMPKPKNFKCDNVKEHMGADGMVHWAMRCENSKMTFASKGKTKITADGFISHVVTTENSGTSGFSMKTMTDVTGKLISDKCPSKS